MCHVIHHLVFVKNLKTFQYLHLHHWAPTYTGLTRLMGGVLEKQMSLEYIN